MEKNRLLELAGVLNEAAEYSDSADFTEDYTTVLECVAKIDKIVKAKRWDKWMKVTDENYGTNTISVNDTFKMHAKRLKEAAKLLETQFDKADGK